MKVFHITNFHTMTWIVNAAIHACILSSSEATRLGKSHTGSHTGEHLIPNPPQAKKKIDPRRRLEEDLYYDWEQIGGNVDAGATKYRELDFHVDISGDGSTVAVGSPFVNNSRGLVRVSRMNASTQTWEVMDSNIVGDGYFDAAGRSVSLSYDGTILAVGFSGDNEFKYTGAGFLHSTVRVYQWNATTTNWNQLGSNIFHVIKSGFPNYPDYFWSNLAGWTVSLSDDGMVVAIGAPNYYEYNATSIGQVRVYKYDKLENEWKQLGQEISGKSWSDNHIGYAVALSGDGTTLVIGNPKADIDTGTGDNITTTTNGSVQAFKFQKEDSVWELHGNAIIGDQEGGATGASVAISTNGSRIAIGHPGYKTGEHIYGGLVRVYEIDTNKSITNSSWNQIGSDVIPNFELEWEDGYGYGDGRSVSLSGDGNTLAVAAPSFSINDVVRGLVRVFRFNDTANDWDKAGKTIPGEINLNNGFHGNHNLVALTSQGNRLVVGAPIHKICNLDWSCIYHANQYINWTGHVRVFDFTEVSTTPLPTTQSPTYAPTTANPTTNNPTTAYPTIAPIMLDLPTMPPSGSGGARIPGKDGKSVWLFLLLLNPLLLVIVS